MLFHDFVAMLGGSVGLVVMVLNMMSSLVIISFFVFKMNFSGRSNILKLPATQSHTYSFSNIV